MKSPSQLARKEVRELHQYDHGGEVWEVSDSDKIDVLDFSSNINPLGIPENISDVLHQNFWRIPFYPDPESKMLRKKISEKFKLNFENILMGNGSCELIYLFTEAFIRSGDTAATISPTFTEYEKAVLKAGGRIQYVPMVDNFKFNSDLFLRKIPPETKMIFICNPNNPTSSLIGVDELIEIVEYALDDDIMVFFDEDFMDFVSFNKRFSMVDYIDDYNNIFIIKSFTKIYGLAGLRIGYGIGEREIIELLRSIKTPWNVNCLAQMAGMEALEEAEYLKRTSEIIDGEREFLYKALLKINAFKVYPPEANFIFIQVRKEGLSAFKLKQELLLRNILIRDCSSFRGLDDRYIRVAVRSHNENQKLVESLKEIAGK